VSPKQAVEFVQRCVEREDYFLRDHFEQRMSERALFWPDVLAVVEQPASVRTDGEDEYGRPRWFLEGRTTGNLEIEILCVLERKGTDTVIFWTIYWDD